MFEEDKKTNWFLFSMTLSCGFLVIYIFYIFYYKKNYDFIVEVRCDPAIETCFERSCSDPADCPPNQLSTFKRYSLSAKDFKSCENENCTYACTAGVIKCEPIECTEDLDVGESCTQFNSPANNE